MRYIIPIIFITCGILLANSAHAKNQTYDWEMTGNTALEYRHFFQDAELGDQHSGTIAPSLIVEPEFYKTTDTDTITARMFLQIDSKDDERTHVDIRQLDWVRAKNNWEIRAGFSKVFWGVTESQHLVDIINQTDSVASIDGEEKLGQPMIQLATFQPWGDLRFYYLPYFRERTFTGSKGRLRGSLIVDTDSSLYNHSSEEWHPDFAMRYKRYIGAWDIGLSHFHGTSREPTLRLITPAKLTPIYEIIDQSSIDIQYTNNSWLWKLEMIGRGGHGDYFGAAVGGFEYTFYNIGGNGTDIGTLIEYHRDGRGNNAPVTSFDNDLFIGTRITLNNIDDTAFLAGTIIDMQDASQSYFIESSTRLNNHMKIELEARIFNDIDSDQPIYSARNDDYLQLQLQYHF